MKMNQWKRDNDLIGKKVEEVVPALQEDPPENKSPLIARSEYDKMQERYKKELETAEHYVGEIRKVNKELQAQVNRLVKKLESAKEDQSGNWRELEQQVKSGKEEYEKLASDYETLAESCARLRTHNDLLIEENDRVSQLNVLLMDNTLKVVEKVGVIA